MNVETNIPYERIHRKGGTSNQGKRSLLECGFGEDEGLLKRLRVAYDGCTKGNPSLTSNIFASVSPLDVASWDEKAGLPQTLVSDEEIVASSALLNSDLQNAWMDDIWEPDGGADDDNTLEDSTRGDLDDCSSSYNDPYQPFEYMPPPAVDTQSETEYYGSVREALESLSMMTAEDGIGGSSFGADGISSGVMDNMPRVPPISMRPTSQNGNPGYVVPANPGDDSSEQLSGRRPVSNRRPLHHPLSSRNSVATTPVPSTSQMPLEMALVKHCKEPTVLTLTSFPFRVICANQAFMDATGKGNDIIGSSFYDLFVKESDQSPTIATTPSLLGIFNDNIVRVVARRTNSLAINGPGGDEDFFRDEQEDDRTFGSYADSLNDQDETSIYCRIKVQGIMKRHQSKNTALANGADLRYFSIKLSPLQIPVSSPASESVVYLPMPCSGTYAAAAGHYSSEHGKLHY